MSDGEKREGTELHALDRRARIEDGVEEQVTALVKQQAERPTGKKLHRVGRRMFIRRRRLQWLHGRAGLCLNRDRQKQGGKQHDQPEDRAAEYGIPVALSANRAGIRIRKLEG